MADLSALHRRLQGADLTFFGEAPVCFHCHHFNLFLDQTVDDALGHEAGGALRTRAAHRASRQLLAGLFEAAGVITPAERVSLAQEIFAAMGHGRLSIDAQRGKGTAHGSHVHYGFCWREKYGRDVRRRHPTDAFAAGYVAAATELAHDLPSGSLWGVETECVAMRAPECCFVAEHGSHAEFPTATSGMPEAQQIEGAHTDSLGEAEIQAINAGLQQFLASVGPDPRGLVQGFGVFVTLHLTNYYNEVSYGAARLLNERAPRSTPVFEALLRESGQVCAFNTFGGILLSPEWEGLVGPLGADPGDIMRHSMAIARALGFGTWSIVEFEPERRIVVRAPKTYEAAYFHGAAKPERPSSYFLQGAVCGLMEMAHRVPWRERPLLDDTFYRALFKQGSRFRVEQTADVARGDRYCEVVVEAGPSR
ncbi:MAG: hypothetical protein JNK45_06865 [Myxococcales bacterium]|nr:hypothetical protein [Myxococcales bacterium]